MLPQSVSSSTLPGNLERWHKPSSTVTDKSCGSRRAISPLSCSTAHITSPQHLLNTQHHPTHPNNTTTHHNTTTQHNQHNTPQHNTTQPNTTQHSPTQHSTTQHNPTQHNTTQPNTTTRLRLSPSHSPLGRASRSPRLPPTPLGGQSRGTVECAHTSDLRFASCPRAPSPLDAY